MRKWNRDTSGHGITEGVIWQQLLLFFFPILLGTFFQQLYNTADAMIVGKYVGKEALAAVGGTTGNLINLIVGFFIGLSSGGTVILSQFYGARDDRNVFRSVQTAMGLAICFGLGLTVIGLILSPAMLQWMNTPEDVMEPALQYLRIYFLGMIPSLIYNIGSGLLRAIGDSRRPLYFLMVACLTNVVMDLLLVMGLDMGVAGAALATIFSQTVSAVLVLLILTRSDSAFRLDWRQMKLHPDLMKRMIRIGLPTGLQSVLYSISNVLIQAFINGFGTNVSAAWSAWGRIDGFQWMTLNAFGIAITTFVGQNYGAMLPDRVRKGVRQCLGMAFAASFFCSGLMMLFGRQFFGLFANDPAVIDQGMEMLWLVAPFYFTYTCVEILSGTLRGAGKTLLPTVFTFTGICVLRLVWLLGYVAAHPSVRLTVISYPATWIITSVMFIIYYLRWRRTLPELGREAA